MSKIADKVFDLIKDAVESEGVRLWDVAFLKEGASKYLRVFIDKDEGISIDDCTDVSHAIDPIIDEADPIDEAYYLEVCSPGIERELKRDEHFEFAVGKPIKVKLFKAQNNIKEIKGVLTGFDGTLNIKTENNEIILSRQEIAKANLLDFD